MQNAIIVHISIPDIAGLGIAIAGLSAVRLIIALFIQSFPHNNWYSSTAPSPI
ncbi:hypothetical protein HNQ06_001023 [Borrelia lanei]|uniref:Uncharacterized protein n=1 Tax=Borreliella lanei TaxID=373540 RepID=A0A7W9ZBL9_9SPIR|nr:hypothetical protein [Borreliella lanei]